MIQCSKCGTANEPGSGFCAKCGNAMAGGQTVNPGNKKNLTIILIVIGVVILLCVTCGIFGLLSKPKETAVESNRPALAATPTPEPFKPWVDIPALANKSPEEFEKVFGKTLAIVPITKTPAEMPGDFRDYKVSGIEDPLEVRFYKGKAVFFSLNLTKDKQTKTAEELARFAGFDTSGMKKESPSAHAVKWSGEAGGARFSEILAVKSDVNDYYVLSVKVQP